MRSLLLYLFLSSAGVSAYADSGILSLEEEQYLLDNPEILFVSQTSYPPFEFIDDNGERQGMCLELVRWMSTEFGFQAAFTDMTFQEAQEAVLEGEADVLTSFFYSEARDLNFDFTEPMYEIPARVYVRPETTDIQTLADLAGKRVSVQRGDYAVDFLRAEGINCIFVHADNFSDAIYLLLDGEVDALVGDEQIVEFHLFNHHSREDIVAAGDTLYIGLNCMSVAEGDSLLCSIINKGIEYALENGIIEGIATKWQGSPITLSDRNTFRYLPHLLVALGLILTAAVLVFFWNLRLRHLVEQRTRSLKESEKRLDQALDQANLGSWDNNILTGDAVNNNRYSLMLGYSPGEVNFSFAGWLNQVHPDDRISLEQYINEYLVSNSGRYETEFRMRTKNGDWVWIHSCGGVVHRDSSGKPVRLTGIHQDITRRKHSESLARKAIDDWENTFDALPELIAVLDSEGVILRVNKAQALALGMTREECVGRKLSSLMFPDVLSGEIKPFSSREMYIDKLQRCFEVSMSVSEDPDDGSIRVIHVARDISERKAAERQQREMEGRVQHAQKLESLGVLAGGIAHDFNNILMAIRGYTDLAISTVKEEGQTLKYLKEINKSVGTASELSGQMLAYSGRGNFVVETVCINDIIEKMRPMIQVSISRKAELQIHTDEYLPPVTVDSTQMEQVILNLLTNASEAIGSSRGIITVTTGLEKTLPPGNTDSGGEERPYIFIQVDDTGCGMSAEVLEKLFEPFFTTKFTGRGLGMAVVHGIVEGHQGFVTVTSEQGAGSSFKVFIPAADKAKNQLSLETERKSSPSNATPAGILLVDDEANIVFIGRHLLQKYNYTVLSAGNGEEALRVYAENKDSIQCVILDLTMPVMDGAECLRELKKIDPAVKVILSSGYNRKDAESRIHSDDIAGYLKKPYGLKALLAVVRSALAAQ